MAYPRKLSTNGGFSSITNTDFAKTVGEGPAAAWPCILASKVVQVVPNVAISSPAIPLQHRAVSPNCCALSGAWFANSHGTLFAMAMDLPILPLDAAQCAG